MNNKLIKNNQYYSIISKFLSKTISILLDISKKFLHSMVNIFRIFPQLITKHPHVFSPYLYISPPTRVFLILIYLAIPDTVVDYPPKIPINDHTLFFHHLRVPLHLNKQTNGQTNEKEKKSKLEEGRKNNGKKNGPEGNLSSALRPLADLSSLTSGERLTFLFT